MVKRGVSLTVRRLWHVLRDLFRCAWSFISRWISARAALSWRRARTRTSECELSNDGDDGFPRPGSCGEDRSEAAAASAVSANRHDDNFDCEEYHVDAADELYCGYDSTWESEERRQGARDRARRQSALRHQHKFRRFESAAMDMHNYRHDYPLSVSPYADKPNFDKPNFEFYTGQRLSVPDGRPATRPCGGRVVIKHMYIDDFHGWYGNYDALESVHTYIQWLFPLQEQGMNSDASTLTKEEIKEFLESCTARANLLKSYKLMLNFYGISLCDENTGEVERAENWRERFNNLNSHIHNSLRITRILKCMGTLGYPHYQYPLVHFFLKETLENEELQHIKDSVLNYFVFAVLDKWQRRRLIKFAYLNYEPKDEFVWCPKKVQMTLSRRFASRAREGVNVKQHANTQQ